MAGWIHDLGKATPEWQAYLRKAQDASDQETLAKVDHKLSGALYAQRWPVGIPIEVAVAGHHGGLEDLTELRQTRLNDSKVGERLASALAAFPLECLLGPVPGLPHWIGMQKDPKVRLRNLDVLTRMVFSALVDADFLDTEEYSAEAGGIESGSRRSGRGGFPSLAEYLPCLETFLGDFRSHTSVHGLRSEVLGACRSAGGGPRGAWTLTVPTGGGKTLSGLAWALHHARTHGLRRVVMALPFTTIIDQTAQVFRSVFGALGLSVLLEHHSNLDPRRETSQNRMASENWDAPLIVTTQVQLFESLFSRKPSTCRKLHRLQDSVIILDEVQSLPRDLLAPLLDILNDLVAHYGVSLLLMTATQPSLASRVTASGFFCGLEPAPREIIPDELATRLWDGLRRVRVHWPGTWDAPDPNAGDFWESLALKVLEHPKVLAICHLKRDAQALYQAIRRSDPEALHLSAAMCPAHRRAVLRQVKQRMRSGRPCRLVSTQVVEAGVDLDFPAVFRAMAGLESLAQSAGRCNREGRLEGMGDFFVYDAPNPPPGILKEHLAVARTLLAADPGLDLFSPETFPTYFRWLHVPTGMDAHGVQPLREQLRFAAVSEAFRMIPEVTESVFLPICRRAKHLLDRLRQEGPSRDLLRALQPYTVSVYSPVLQELLSQGALETIQEHYALHQSPGPHYDPAMGFASTADATVLLFC
jgi:CRISPR-associated endonuclease/helicase Cas3